MESRYGGALSLASHEDILHQDVHQELSPALSTWGPGVAYSRLMRFKSGPEVALPSLAVECDLCESWETEDDRTFVFRLRQGVRWQSIEPVGGRMLTSGDIVFSYERQRQQGWPNAPLLQAIVGLESPRPDTVRISLSAPDVDFMASLADGHSKIVAREVVDVRGDLRSGPTVGTGPWVLRGNGPGLSHSFERNPDYFEEGLPLIETLVIHVIADPITRDAAFKTRAVDVHQMEPEEWDAFQQQRPNAPFLEIRDPGAGLEVALKTTVAPFDDVRVRRAVFQAMDPWRAIEDIWLGAGFVGLGFPSVEADWLLPEREVREYVGDSTLAGQLLRQTGLDLPVSVTIRAGDFGELYRAHARRIADEMEAVGFEPILELVNRRVFGDEVWLGGDYQMLVGPIAPQTTTNGYLLPVLHSLGRWNATGHQDEELDAMILAQAQETDALARRALLLGIQRHVLGNAYRFVPASRVSIWTWWPRVQGFHPNFAGSEYFHWARVWVRD